MPAVRKVRNRKAKGRAKVASSAAAVGERSLERALDEAIKRHRDIPGALIPALHKAQELYGYLPEHVIRRVAAGMGVPLSEVWGVVTFYSFFSTTPLGRYQIRVCLGTACFVRGARRLVDEVRRLTGVEVGGVTEDGKFSLEVCRCLGCCSISPVISINGEIHQKVTPKSLRGILAGCA